MRYSSIVKVAAEPASGRMNQSEAIRERDEWKMGNLLVKVGFGKQREERGTGSRTQREPARFFLQMMTVGGGASRRAYPR